MSDLPILFSGTMVRALVAGTKTQTRRIIKFAGIEKVLDFVKVATDMEGRPVYEMKDANGQHIARPAGKGFVDYQFWPRFGVGDRLYVREHWRAEARLDKKAPRDIKTNYPGVKYIATDEPDDFGIEGKFRQGMHMPRWASRLTLVVTDVRVQKLQDITEVDAIAEGITCHNVIVGNLGSTGHHIEITADRFFYDGGDDDGFEYAEDAYAALWDQINGPGSSGTNPWVVAYTFEVIKGNIDQIGGGK